MTRIDSLSILNEGSGKDKLAEEYGKVIYNIEKGTISSRLKNRNLSGNPNTGSVDAKRFATSNSQNYGTARSGGKGQNIKAKPVTISLNIDKELINEVEEKDVFLYGVNGLIERRASQDQKSMERELETAFFQKAHDSGTDAELTAIKEIEKWLETLIQKVETVKNDYVVGVPRDMIHIVLDTATYGLARNYLDKIPNANVNSASGEFGTFHGVNVYSSIYLPSGINAIAMCEESIAQPVLTWQDEAGKIPLSNSYHFGMFYSYGTEAVMPDLIFKATYSAGE